jgi:putative hydrolase of the HAD superfamily
VLLDAVGTLIHARPPVDEVYCQAAREIAGLDVAVSEIRSRLKRSMAELLRAEDTTNEELEYAYWQAVVRGTFPELSGRDSELFRYLWDHFARAEHWRAADDLATAWARLEQLGLTLGIASNFDMRLRHICRDLPPLDRAEALFLSSEVGFRKPHIRFFRAIETKLRVPPQSCVLVGDQLATDCCGALCAGWRAIWITPADEVNPPPGTGEISLAAGQAVVRAPSLCEAVEFIERWAANENSSQPTR